MVLGASALVDCATIQKRDRHIHHCVFMSLDVLLLFPISYSAEP